MPCVTSSKLSRSLGRCNAIDLVRRSSAPHPAVPAPMPREFSTTSRSATSRNAASGVCSTFHPTPSPLPPGVTRCLQDSGDLSGKS